jgi:hypothetical protein
VPYNQHAKAARHVRMHMRSASIRERDMCVYMRVRCAYSANAFELSLLSCVKKRWEKTWQGFITLQLVLQHYQLKC